MNTTNGNFIEKSIPDTKNATIALNIGGVDSTMSVANFATAIASPAPYKVFTALLTQSGGDDPQDLCLGAVTKGVTYTIDGTGMNADFSNVGGPKFAEPAAETILNVLVIAFTVPDKTPVPCIAEREPMKFPLPAFIFA